MTDPSPSQAIAQTIERIYRAESGRILASLIGLLGDFELAEEALQDAITTALERWPSDGVPAHAPAGQVGTGRHKGLDHLRRLKRGSEKLAEFAAAASDVAPEPAAGIGAVPPRLPTVFRGAK